MLRNEITEEMIDSIEAFLKISSDATRLKILYSLYGKELCVCNLQSSVGASQSLISHQLTVLRKGGFVKKRKEGKHCYYSLSDDHVTKLLELVYEHVIEETTEEEDEDGCTD